MSSLDPLKSVISLANVDDTSLALPSVTQCHTGQLRVLEQVQTIRRTKSRSSSSSSRKGAASLSPTSPLLDMVFVDAGRSNGSGFTGNGFSHTLSKEKNIHQQSIHSSKGSSMKRNISGFNYHYEQNSGQVGSMVASRNDSSRSEPDMAWQRSLSKRSIIPQRMSSNRGTYRADKIISQYRTSNATQPVDGSGQSRGNSEFISSKVDTNKTWTKHHVTEPTFKNKSLHRSSWNSGVSDINMKEAVAYLSIEDEQYKLCGASYIQHNTFIDDKAKEEVLKLRGIPPLVALLSSQNPQISQTAAAALRNLSFKNNATKEEIARCGAVTQAAALLRHTDITEMEKQLTGLLWNLSSLDSLKPELLNSALPVLMDHVILPCTTGQIHSIINSPDQEVFFHATGCLRNLSSSRQSNRQAMRKCRGLIDSLVSYVTGCVEADKPDDKSVENCVCILHNLTFQLEAEAPALFSRITALAKTASRRSSQDDAGPLGCFIPQNKGSENQHHHDFPVVEDPQPKGAGWLIHSKTLQSYLTLLGSSQREETLEACCGALHNLTAHEGIVSSIMSWTIVQKLHGLEFITPLLRSEKVNLQNCAVALVGNLTKNSKVHRAIAWKALPELIGILSAGTKEGNESDDTLAMACQAANYLLTKEPERSKHLLNNTFINSLGDISRNRYFPKSSKSAALLLHNLWSDKDIQSFLKRQGMNKSSFVNDITTAAHKSGQIVD